MKEEVKAIKEKIEIMMTNGALAYKITLQKYAINENTKEWLLEEIKTHLETLMENYDE